MGVIMPFSSSVFSYLLVVFAGACVALQQVLNANLRAHLGSPWWAGSVSYLVGLIAMLAVALIAPGPRFTESFTGGASWLSWSGGIFGAMSYGVTVSLGLFVQAFGERPDANVQRKQRDRRPPVVQCNW